MEWLNNLLRNSSDLSIIEMVVRGLAVFILSLLILRFAGKRTFGQQSAADKVIMITLGALLSRAIVGASPFWPVIFTSFSIVLLHRVLAWFCIKYNAFEALIKGDEVLLFKNGQQVDGNMQHELISKAELAESIRMQLHQDSMEEVSKIIIERNGRISVVKKS